MFADVWRTFIACCSSPEFSAIANLIQVGTVVVVALTYRSILHDRQRIGIVVECADGRRKKIGEIPRRLLTRGEIMGWVSMKTGSPRLDFTGFNPDFRFPGREVLVPLSAADFEFLDNPRRPAAQAPSCLSPGSPAS